MNSYDVAIIGSGPGGYVAAIRCAQLGLKTAIIEKYDTLGGTCLNVGCIPSKALLDSSEHFYNATHNFAEHGVLLKDIKADIKQMVKRKGDVVAQTSAGVKFLMNKNNVDILTGKGSFVDKNTIKGLGINLKSWDSTTKGTPTDWIHLTGSNIRYYPTPGATPGNSYVYGFATPDSLVNTTDVAVAIPSAFRMSAILDRAEAEARKSRSTTANNVALYGTLMENWRGWCGKIADAVKGEG
jgi:pyruvate/2-oxoglutarate dehydrogenase complex dihydrolipoamide dehydrogenase (E3) component